MKTATRFAIIGASVLLCAGGILTANSWREEISNSGTSSGSIDATARNDGYQFAASSAWPKLTFQQLETIIRGDPTAKSQRGRIEFGSVRMEEGTALAEVMFVSNDGRVLPFLYKLLPERDSWKIVNVRRIWYVPRSHLLRGVRA
jgi:hypothetical protein